MTGYYCPVDGCEYGAEADKSKAAVRAHVNATSRADHTWSDLADAVEQQGETDDQAGEPSGSSTETNQEQAREQAEAATNADTAGMGEEYREQMTAAAGDGGGREPDAIEDPDDSDSGGGSGWLMIAGTVALGAAVVLGSRSSETSTPTDGERGAESDNTDMTVNTLR